MLMSANKHINKFKTMPIHDVALEYGFKLRKIGDKYRALCRFHDDRRNPNLFFYPHNDSFYCFSCHKGGSKEYFISLLENIDLDKVRRIWDGDRNVSQEALKLDMSPKIKNYRDLLQLISAQLYYIWAGGKKSASIMVSFDEFLYHHKFVSKEEYLRLVNTLNDIFKKGESND